MVWSPVPSNSKIQGLINGIWSLEPDVNRTRDHIANIRWIVEKAEFQKNIYFLIIDYAKDFDSVDHNTGKFFKRWGYQITLPASWEICMQVKKQQLELDMK